jgi:hypothetical protein
MVLMLNEQTRGCLAIDVTRRFRGEAVASPLDEPTTIQSTSARLRTDNGPGLVSKSVKAVTRGPRHPHALHRSGAAVAG